ncbi:Brefeldin A resistance protein, partial [Durusdinium trenchii]
VSGFAIPGRILGVLGSSTLARDALVRCIAKHPINVPFGRVSGRLFVNGHLQNRATPLIQLVGFCSRDFVMCPQLTLLEAMQLSAGIRQPHVASKQRNVWIRSIIQAMQLDETVASMRVESLMDQGLEQEVAILIESAANPSVLVVEEVASKGRRRASERVIWFLRCMASAGRTVICTADFPWQSVFDTFDDLVLLTPDGQTTYFGEADELATYLLGLPKVVSQALRACDEAHVRGICADLLKADVEAAATRIQLEKVYLASDRYRQFYEELQQVIHSAEAYENTAGPAPHSRRVARFRTLCFLVWRLVITSWRMRALVSARWATCGVLGLVLGLAFFRRAVFVDLRNVVSTIAWLAFVSVVLGVVVACSIVSEERFHLERVFAVVCFAVAGIPTGDLAHLVALTVLFCLSSVSLGRIMVSLVPSKAGACGAAATIIVAGAVLFGGVVIPQNELPETVTWARYGFGVPMLLSGFVNALLSCPCAVDLGETTCNGGLICQEVCDPSALGCERMIVESLGTTVLATLQDIANSTFGVASEDQAIIALAAQVLIFRALQVPALNNVI